jgi:phage terminase small subunit
MRALNEREKRFCQEYTVDWNGTRAAKAVGYSPKTCRATASKLLAKPHIKAYIKEIQNDLEQLAGISRYRVLKEYMKIAFSSISKTRNGWITRKQWDSVPQEVKDSISELDTKVLQRNLGSEDAPDIVDVEYVKVKLHDKVKALENICKMLGYNAPDEVNMTNTIRMFEDAE